MPEKSILIVDDDEKIIKMLTFLFLSRGYEVSSVRNGIEALEYFEVSLPSIVILDLAMPQMDGVILHSKMKDHKNLKDIPVIILSALPPEENLYKLKLQDPRYYLQKPFRTAEILSLLNEIKEKGQANDVSPSVELCTDKAPYPENRKNIS